MRFKLIPAGFESLAHVFQWRMSRQCKWRLWGFNVYVFVGLIKRGVLTLVGEIGLWRYRNDRYYYYLRPSGLTELNETDQASSDGEKSDSQAYGYEEKEEKKGGGGGESWVCMQLRLKKRRRKKKKKALRFGANQMLRLYSYTHW